MPFHYRGYIVADRIAAGRQQYGILIARSDIPGNIRYICLQRKAGFFPAESLPALKMTQRYCFAGNRADLPAPVRLDLPWVPGGLLLPAAPEAR